MDLLANPVFKAFLAGSFSGTCTTILLQPLDLVKTRIQSSKSEKRLGMFSVARQVLEMDRLPGLWRGMVPSIARTVPGVGLYFGSLHWLKTVTLGAGAQPSPVEAVTLGVVARSIAGGIMIPVTVIKTRFESDKYNYRKISGAFVEIYLKEGIRGLTCGLLPTLIRDAPFSGIYLMFYTQLKQRVGQVDNGQMNNPATHFVCGLIAGFLASVVTHPADVVKTRMQLQPDTYVTMRNAVHYVWSTSGFRGFTSGIVPRVLRRSLMPAVSWTVYEGVMKRVGIK